MGVATGGDPTRCVWRRFFSWLADGLVQLVVVVLMMQLLGVDVTRERNTGTLYDFSADGDPAAFGALVFTLLVIFVVEVILIGKLGWTVGKLLLGLRVVGWDGRPVGVPRALLRQFVFWLGQGLFGCFYWLLALFTMTTTRAHRQPADFVASTFVIDNWFSGRMLIERENGVIAGPPAVKREDAERYLVEHGVSKEQAATIVAPGPKTTKPFYDKERDTYVVWNEGRREWMQFDKASSGWIPMR